MVKQMPIINLKAERKYCINTYKYGKDVKEWRKKHPVAINKSKVKLPNWFRKG